MELHRIYERVNVFGDAQLLSLVSSLQAQKLKTSSLNSKSKQERANTSLLSVNIKTNTTADKHRVEQTGYDNKQVDQIMSNTEQKK